MKTLHMSSREPGAEIVKHHARHPFRQHAGPGI